MILGSLRSQLLYPNKDTGISDDELLQMLETVNVPDLVEKIGGLDVELDWEKCCPAANSSGSPSPDCC